MAVINESSARTGETSQTNLTREREKGRGWRGKVKDRENRIENSEGKGGRGNEGEGMVGKGNSGGRR